MKKKIVASLLIVLIVCVLCACKQQNVDNTTLDPTQDTTQETAQEATLPQNSYFNITIKESPDKYTWYIKNYVGRNCAAIGEFDSDGYLEDDYGEGSIKIIIIAEDGSFVDSDTLKDYVVIEQSIAPNTELKYVFQVDENGKESDYFIATQNIEEMEIYVRKIESN